MNLVTVYDDRDPIVQYTGNWGRGGDPDEYRGTTTWTATIGATASVTFIGRGISVYGAISPNIPGRGKGPIATFTLDSNPASSARFAGEQMSVPQRRYLMHSVSGLDHGEHVLKMENESIEGYFFVDYIEVIGTNPPESSPNSSSRVPAIDPTPNAPAASSSTLGSSSSSSEAKRASQISSGPTSLPNPSDSDSPHPSQVGSPEALLSHSLILPSSVSGTTSSPHSLPTSHLPEPSQAGSRDTGLRLEAIIGGTIGGIAATCTLFLIFAICMRGRRRRRYGNIGSPSPEMQENPQRSISPYSTSNNQPSSLIQHSKSLPSFGINRTHTEHSEDSSNPESLAPQNIFSNMAAIPLTKPSSPLSSEFGPPPHYEPPV